MAACEWGVGMTWREEQIGDARLILGDCREVLPTLGPADAVVTDPPYGLEDWNTRGTNAKRGQGRAWKNLGRYKNGNGHECAQWDEPMSGADIGLLLSFAKHQIIWGANYHLDYLPRTKQMFVWNKGIRNMHFNDCELAWTSQWKEACRVFDFSPSAAEEKQHPTQKPLALMRWCIERLPDSVVTICDPFMGSGTTGVACAKLGKQFIGIEVEPRYFEIAVRRIDEAYKQGDMFIERPKPAKQEAMEI